MSERFSIAKMWNRLLIAIIIGFISIGIGLAVASASKTMQVRVHSKDLPRYGLLIVKPSAPEFASIAKGSISNLTGEELELLRPLSVGVINNSSKTVVAHTVIWTGTTIEGATKSYNLTYANSEFFTDRAEFARTVTGNLDKTIPPGKSRLLTLATFRREGPAGGGGGTRESGEATSNAQTSENDGLSGSFALLRSEFMRFADITVSIDAIFFDDGTFVGPDTLGFFDRLKGQVEAKRNLRNFISESLAANTAESEIYAEIERMAALDVREPSGPMTTGEYANYFARFFAQNLLAQRRVYGDSATLQKAAQSQSEPQPELTRAK